MRIALFPGSFDPFHKGHEEIVNRIVPLFDKIVIGIGNNTAKQYLFSLEKRKTLIEAVFKNTLNIEVEDYSGLTIDFCLRINAGYIIRGLRHAGDFEFEQSIAQMNQAMNPDIQTLFIPCKPELSAISSTILRDIIRHGGNIEDFIPEKSRQIL